MEQEFLDYYTNNSWRNLYTVSFRSQGTCSASRHVHFSFSKSALSPATTATRQKRPPSRKTDILTGDIKMWVWEKVFVNIVKYLQIPRCVSV